MTPQIPSSSFAASFIVFVFAGVISLLSEEFTSQPLLQWYMVVTAAANGMYFYYLNAVAEFSDELQSSAADWLHYLFTVFQYALIYSMWSAMLFGGKLGFGAALIAVYASYAVYDVWHWKEVWSETKKRVMVYLDLAGLAIAILLFFSLWNLPEFDKKEDMSYGFLVSSLCLLFVLLPLGGTIFSRLAFQYKPFHELHATLTSNSKREQTSHEPNNT